MQYCTRCGTRIPNGAHVCHQCGSPAYYSPVPSQSTSVTPLVLGILGIVFAWQFSLIGHILSIIGIVLGTKEYKQNGKISGLIVSVIGEVCAVISSVIAILLLSMTAFVFGEVFSELAPAPEYLAILAYFSG